MKTKLPALAAILFITLSAFLINSCQDKTYEEVTYKANVPVVMGFDEFRSAVKKTAPHELTTPGKIYFKDNYIFVNEFQQGIHVIDNSNPAEPVILNFIEIPGNIDMAVKGNILYADSYIDLVAIDISDPHNPVEVDRFENAFPNVLPPMEDYSYPVYGLDFSKGVVVGWETREVTEVIEKENSSGFGGRVMYDDATGVPSIGNAEVGFNPSSVGIGGSMAGFTLVGDYLYALHNNEIKQFNLTTVPGIAAGTSIQTGVQAETLFPYGNKLFMGSTTGMVVYDVSNPSTISFVSQFTHINSCDPVVIEGNYAYVTLRSGTQCNSFSNQLDVVDISNIQTPFLVKSYPLFNPHGLGIDNHTLFICDGEAGLKVYDATNPMEINMHQLAHFADIKTYDVIPYDGLLMMIGDDGLYQYDYTNLDSLKLLSHLPIGN
ncbi:MAG TPA: hypothetical protein VK172_00960 [Lentimicrobium sp.]|nr:hypothetical protein [Lentimicrobium sp.]